MEAACQRIPHRQYADEERTVALAERAVITPTVAVYLTQHAAKFRHCRQPDKQADLCAVKRGDKGERQIQRGISGNIGDFVQIAAQCRLLTELARQHSVHRVQRHADKQPHGQQPKQSRNLRAERQQNTLMKLISWNIDSLNAALTSDSARAQLSQAVLQTLQAENADVIAIQETKLSATGPTKKHLEILTNLFPDYENTWRSSQEPARKGYAGTMFLYKKELTPTVTFPEIGAPSTMDVEGRIITLEFDGFFVTQVYTPNAGDGLKRLDDRQVWDAKYAEYLATLDEQKPVLATGDYNVAHKEIDLANPASNRRSPGFTDEERAGFTNLILSW